LRGPARCEYISNGPGAEGRPAFEVSEDSVVKMGSFRRAGEGNWVSTQPTDLSNRVVWVRLVEFMRRDGVSAQRSYFAQIVVWVRFVDAGRGSRILALSTYFSQIVIWVRFVDIVQAGYASTHCAYFAQRVVWVRFVKIVEGARSRHSLFILPRGSFGFVLSAWRYWPGPRWHAPRRLSGRRAWERVLPCSIRTGTVVRCAPRGERIQKSREDRRQFQEDVLQRQNHIWKVQDDLRTRSSVETLARPGSTASGGACQVGCS
jgi:hypothetical protein